MRDLRRYREKRDPDRTPEPFGEDRPQAPLPAGSPRGFTVQQHAARNMHWDLRLEIDGVLVSWAIPKGPSLDPGEKRLAVQTEDHPLEYGDFEGVIPAGNYGAGAMIVWDRGVYRTVDGSPASEGLAAGKLDLRFEGHKLIGHFALVRLKDEDGRSWLFLCKSDRSGREGELVEALPASVFSGLTVAELRDGVSRDAELASGLRGLRAPRARDDPASLRPMLASRAETPFSREGWLFELKYDGVRVLATKQGDRVTLRARTGGDRTHVYPEVALAVSHLPVEDAILDGEVVALDARGRSSFERIQRRFTNTDPAVIERLRTEVPVVFYAFDLPRVSGRDLRGLPLAARKALLARFAPRVGVVRFADHVEGDGRALFDAAHEHGLEGVVAKRADAPYEDGRRARSWLKMKVPRSAALAIVGTLAGRGSRRKLGSLMVAWARDGQLVYAGNVGSGLDDDTLARLEAELPGHAVEVPAFEGAPEPGPRRATFVTPKLVCEVSYTEVTSAGLLRHPVFVRLLPDVDPLACPAPAAPAARADAEAAAMPPPPPTAPAELEITRPEKVFWPVEGYTKGDLLGYYEAIWPWLSVYLRDRPVVLTRYPDGIEGKHFYQKNAPGFTPEWVTRETIDETDYFVCNDLRTLLYVINSGAIPLHVWSARVGSLDRPDWLLIDLDPKKAPFSDVVTIAKHIHRLLDDLDATHVVKTSGQDGLHVLLPLGGLLDHADARRLGEVLARVVVADLPEIATITRPLAGRGDKVYVDFLQNGRGQLIAAPYSVRPRAGAPVSMPLTWRQVTANLDPSRWTIRTARRRIERHGDPVARVLGAPVDVDDLLARLAEHLG